jgi:5-methylcytosine-specific restriction endonuclease McrA
VLLGVTSLKSRRDKVDTVFSLVVRARDNHTCQNPKCGKTRAETVIQCSHIYSRRHKATRWDEKNAKALCFKCHLDWHSNPTEARELALTWMSEEELDALARKAWTPTKIRKDEKEEIYKRLKARLEELEE